MIHCDTERIYSFHAIMDHGNSSNFSFEEVYMYRGHKPGTHLFSANNLCALSAIEAVFTYHVTMVDQTAGPSHTSVTPH